MIKFTNSFGTFTKPSSTVRHTVFAVLTLFLGVYSIALSIALLEIFHRTCNTKGGALRGELARSAYCVYVIHPAVLNLNLCAFELVMLRVANIDIARHSDWSQRLHPNYSAMELDSIALWSGWVCVALATQLIVWPLAMIVRRLPLLKRVL